MEYNPYQSTSLQIAHGLNKGLVDRNADHALAMLCLFMRHHNLAASPRVVEQIPVKPEPDVED